jgi:hypothetical protein
MPPRTDSACSPSATRLARAWPAITLASTVRDPGQRLRAL